MNPTAIYSKSGKGVQEASGKTSLLQRGDRAVLAAIDGRATLADVAQKIGKPYDAAFQKIIGQLDKDGFIREVTAGTPAAAPAKPAAAAPVSRPVSKPLGKPERSLGDLDFSSLGGASKPASRPAAPAAPSQSAMEQTTVLAKAREEAEAKAAAERDKLKKEAEAKARAEMEAQVRTEAEDKLKQEAAARAKAEADAKARAAQEAAARVAAEAKAKAEAEARARVEAEAKAKLEAERKAREELERKLEAERKLREEAERKAKAEAERKAKEEAERARREAEENARREAEVLRKAREEAERARKEAEEKARLEAERQREAARRREEEQRKQREAEEAAQREAAAAAAAAAAAMANVAAAPGPGDGVTKKGKKKDSFADSLLADLESFTSDDGEAQKTQQEAERQAQAESARRGADLTRKVKEEAERRRQQEEEERRLAEEARRAQEEEARRAQQEERRAQEEERRKREAEEIRRKAEAATVAAMAAEGKKHEPQEEDIPVTDDDLDMTEVEREEAELVEAREKEKEEKERAAKKEKKKKIEADYAPPPPSRPRRPIKWGKPVALTLALVLVIGVGAAHIVPLDASGYERISSEALGRTVKIGSARLWLFSGLPQLRFENVRVGNARIARVVASGWPGGIFGDKKEFRNVRIEGLSLPQEAIADALFARVRADNLAISTVTIKNLQLPGPATLPKDLLAEAAFDSRGRLRSAKVEGPDGLVAKLTPKEDGSINFEAFAGGFTLPIAPQVTLSKFAMHGVATPRGMTINDWGGAIFQGGISGKANVRWSGSWNVDGVVTVRNINAAVFAPALLSSGNADGTAKFSMSAPDAAGLVAGSRLDGTFTVNQGTLGSFDLARYIQSGGRQAAGVTQFAEMNGQATYDRGSVALRNVNIGAGRLNAGASADIAKDGVLFARIVVDLRVSDDTRRATLIIGGTVKEPQLRN
ncbi:MAG TPA: hypothetical protein VLI89_01415 [Burkholderiales bacterium]|nr:hypothetical protein [Burkholderiales bacterium]